MENLNLLFYKTFYTKLGDNTWFDREKKITIFENDIANKSKELIASRFYKKNYESARICDELAADKFMLKTAYPGLLAGTGYAHGVDSKEDIKLGFSFDFVTGQPYIPGSSVKGLLRSYFGHHEIIKLLLGKENIDVDALKKNIFGTQADAFEDGVDTFFDAVIRRGDKNGRVIGVDAITPHGTDLTKNPIPIKMLKILPEVVLEFSFNLKDYKEGDMVIVSSQEKKDLFKKILINFGIGAKTNVGYGVLVSVEAEEVENYIWPEKNTDSSLVPAGNTATPRTNYNTNRESLANGVEFVKDKVYEGVVSGGNLKKIFIKIIGNDCRCFLKRDYMRVNLEDGEKIKVSYLYTDDYGNNCFKYVGKV